MFHDDVAEINTPTRQERVKEPGLAKKDNGSSGQQRVESASPKNDSSSGKQQLDTNLNN